MMCNIHIYWVLKSPLKLLHLYRVSNKRSAAFTPWSCHGKIKHACARSYMTVFNFKQNHKKPKLVRILLSVQQNTCNGKENKEWSDNERRKDIAEILLEHKPAGRSRNRTDLRVQGSYYQGQWDKALYEFLAACCLRGGGLLMSYT
jgi:hypothetical protein